MKLADLNVNNKVHTNKVCPENNDSNKYTKHNCNLALFQVNNSNNISNSKVFSNSENPIWKCFKKAFCCGGGASEVVPYEISK